MHILVHDDVIKWKHFPRFWPFVRVIHRSLVNSPYKGQWRGALKFLWSAPWINGWVNNDEAGDLRRHRIHYDVIVMNMKFRQLKGVVTWGMCGRTHFCWWHRYRYRRHWIVTHHQQMLTYCSSDDILQWNWNRNFSFEWHVSEEGFLYL